MQNELQISESGMIPIYTNDEGQHFINAKELHKFLEVGKKYATWIQDRIEKYEFEENIDFFPVLGKSTGGRPSTEYYLSFDTAKEIAMVQNNEKGRTIRKYFIQVETEFYNTMYDQLEEAQALDKEIANAQQVALAADAWSKVCIARTTEYVKAYGIPKSEASIIVHKAKIEGVDPDTLIFDVLVKRHSKELAIKRNRIYVRMQTLGMVLKDLYPNLEEDPFEYGWHLFSSEMRMEMGHTVSWQKRHKRDKANFAKINASRGKGVKKQNPPGYLDYIEEAGCQKEAEKVANRLLAKYRKRRDTVKAKQKEAKFIDDIRLSVEE